MGLTYKALKYRDIKMNMTKAKAVNGNGYNGDDDGSNNVGADVKPSNQQALAVASAVCPSLMDVTATTATDKSQNFTAEHIMQLCLFLAEKSRAKQLQQNQEMNARRYYENFLREANEFVEAEQMHVDYDPTLSHNPNQSISNECKWTQIKHNNSSTSLQVSTRAGKQTKLKSETFSKQMVLTDKCTTMCNNNLPSSNSLPEVYEKLAQNSHSYPQPQQQQQQDKRDILLKIRQQIFERKRLRQVLNGSGGGGFQLEHGQYLQPKYHQKPVGFEAGYSNEELERQTELQQMGDVWRPW